VHRLDRNTQGLIIGAKNVIAARVLSQKIKDHEIDKYYLAHVYGIIDPKNGTLHDYLTKDTRKDIKGNFVKITKKPISKDSKEIVTEYKTLSYDKTTSVIEIHLITGKTHQIRAHMNYIKHPLVGERKYTTDLYEKNDDIYQSLISYKIIFNFKTDALSLNYLKNKTISLTINKQTFFV
jgi:23S rRNA pseudouridine955/2504/2580 synthase